jgi:hypothetical protein
MTDHTATLGDVTALTLETLCFFYPEVEVSELQEAATVDGTMSVRFEGPLTGRVVVRLCGGLLPLLASNMLGDVDGDYHMQRDALAEVTNVICGNLMPLIGGAEAAFVLRAPQPVIDLTGAAPHPTALVRFGLEESGRVDVMLYFDPT